ncbi:MAG TPA: Nif3-like dinuclear metal center hexameric protein [Candidatus Kapabacteria bacterium]|nr:Nif3-like dinuclear metal center hexameric protein [Candidatus Kapabacteria bacterium]
MLISELLGALSKTFPLSSAGYEKDAVGLQIGYDNGVKLTKALIAYEVTDEVATEAIDIGANLIIAYHPLIFPSVSAITDTTRTGALTRLLIKKNIALYVLHTAFDAHSELGTSALMASALGLVNCKALAPLDSRLEKIIVFVPTADAAKVQEAMWAAGAGHIGNYDEASFSVEGTGTFRGNEKANPAIGAKLVRENVAESRIEMIVEKWTSAAVIRAMMQAHPYEEVAYDRYPLSNEHPTYGMGTIGELPNEMSVKNFLDLTASTFTTPVLRYNEVSRALISRIALVGGAGMDYYSAALRAGADAFITSDIRYHDFYKAKHDGLLLVDAGHAETERFVRRGMYNAVNGVYKSVDLHREIGDSFVVESRTEPNAVQYYLYDRKPENL